MTEVNNEVSQTFVTLKGFTSVFNPTYHTMKAVISKTPSNF